MELGVTNKLRVSRIVTWGVMLADDDGREILLPNRFTTGQEQVGQKVWAFVYTDSEDRPVATTEVPKAQVGDFALMRVNEVNAVGAWLDWGLSGKELLVPFSEQRVRMQAGRSYVVRVLVDEQSQRVVASAKLGKFLDNESRPDYYHREKASVLVVQRTELGYKVIVDDRYWGLLYADEVWGNLNVGDRRTAFVKQVRPDGKIDLTLEKIEKLRVDDLGATILKHLQEHGGTMPLTDKSTPEEIAKAFSCSKKDFKKALGLLYRNKQVLLEPDATKLVK